MKAPVSSRPVVLLGEVHSSPTSYAEEKKVLEKLKSRGYGVLVTEAPQKQQETLQPAIDAFVKSARTEQDEDRFYKATRPYTEKWSSAWTFHCFLQLCIHAQDLGYEVIWSDPASEQDDVEHTRSTEGMQQRNEAHTNEILRARKEGKNVVSIQGMSHLFDEYEKGYMTTQELLKKEEEPCLAFRLDGPEEWIKPPKERPEQQGPKWEEARQLMREVYLKDIKEVKEKWTQYLGEKATAETIELEVERYLAKQPMSITAPEGTSLAMPRQPQTVKEAATFGKLRSLSLSAWPPRKDYFKGVENPIRRAAECGPPPPTQETERAHTATG